MDTFVVEEPQIFPKHYQAMGPVRCDNKQTGDEVCLSKDFDEVSIQNFEHNFPQILRRQILLEKNNPKTNSLVRS